MNDDDIIQHIKEHNFFFNNIYAKSIIQNDEFICEVKGDITGKFGLAQGYRKFLDVICDTKEESITFTERINMEMKQK